MTPSEQITIIIMHTDVFSTLLGTGFWILTVEKLVTDTAVHIAIKGGHLSEATSLLRVEKYT